MQDNNEFVNGSNKDDILKMNSDDENNDEIPSLNLTSNEYNYDDIFADNKQIKRNGRGSWCGSDATATLVKKEVKPTLSMTRVEYNEMLKFREEEIKYMKNCPEFKAIYDISQHKESDHIIKVIEKKIINKFHIPLDYANVSSVVCKNDTIQFICVSVGGQSTQEIIRFLLPHLTQSYNVETIQGRPALANLTLTSIIDPNEKVTAFTGNGKKEEPIYGGTQTDLTNTMHFGRVFEFLKAIKFPKNKKNIPLLENALRVLQNFKKEFTRVHTDHIKEFNYALDSILFQYFSRGLIPPPEFNLKLLETLFNPDVMYDSRDLFFQENESKVDINQVLRFANKDEIEKSKEKENNLVSYKIPKDLFTIKDVMDNYCNTLYVNNKLPRGVVYDEKDEKESKKNGNHTKSNNGNGVKGSSSTTANTTMGTTSTLSNIDLDKFMM